MMRLHTYLTERTQIIDVMETSIARIQRECGRWLKESGGHLAWRGSMEHNDIIMNKKVRQDRQPMDSDPTMHQVLDKAFEMEFGWKARSQGLFITGDDNVAGQYGFDYAVFPVGDFKYVWSPNVRDLYTSRSNLLRLLGVDYESAVLGREEDVVKWIRKKGYTDTGLSDALNYSGSAGFEIMVKCEKYHAIKQEYIEYYIKEKYDSSMSYGEMHNKFAEEVFK